MATDRCNLGLTEPQVESLSKNYLKKIIGKNKSNAAFKELSSLKESHKKVKHIKCNSLEMLSYLQSDNICIYEA